MTLSVDVASWLRGLGLGEYVAAFEKNAIDGDVLRDLTGDDLREIGVGPVGHRRKLLAAIAAMDADARPSAGPVTAATPSAGNPAEAERRQLTVMFCDIVGSTALSTQFDPEDLRELINLYHRAVADTVVRFDGFVAKYMGDGVLIYFGYPMAHEDDAERSVRAGLAVIDAVSNLAGRVTLRVRIGIATGLAVVGDLIGAGAAQERGVVGETPNLAARVQGLAEPNTIVIADGTRRQVGGLFEYADLGPKTLAGFAEPQRAWRVIGESGVLSRFEALRSGTTHLIGRDEEVEILTRRWDRAKAGEGQVVLLSGEPGIGKSRITEAMLERLQREPHTRLRYFCSPHHRDSALWPVIVRLERAAGFGRDDTDAEKREKTRRLFGRAALNAGDLALLDELLSLPNDAATLHLSPARKREKLFDALLAVMMAEAHDHPALLVFEDLHWLDPTSRDLLDLAVDRIRRLPVLLLATFRPEFQAPWGGRAHVTSLVLNRLGGRDGAALIRELAGNSGLPAETVAEIVARTDGVPLFVEELTKAVLEGGGQSQALLATTPGVATPVPATLHAALMARLDRLGPAAKEIAQVGAVLGREFAYELIEAVARRPAGELHAALAQLGAAELLFSRGTPPQASYMFKHALVQDAAYGTLLRGRRQELHGRAAAALAARFPDLVERQPELLAHHRAGAGEVAAAVAQWLKAGELSASRSAHAEALTHLGHGLTLLATLAETPERDDLELSLLFARATSFLATKGFTAPETSDAYMKARDLAERRNDEAALFTALWGLGLSWNQGLRFDDAIGISEKLLVLSNTSKDDGIHLQAHHLAWTSMLWTGRPVGALRHCEAGERLYDMDRHRSHVLTYGGHDPGACARQAKGLAAWLCGYPDQSRAAYSDAIRLAGQLNHPVSMMLANVLGALGSLLVREPAVALERVAAAEAVAAEQRLITMFDVRVMRGGAIPTPDASERAAREIQEGLDARAGSNLLRPYGLGLLSEARRRMGDWDGALAAVTEALALVQATGEVWWEPELLRIRAMLLADRGELAETETVLTRAVTIARGQQAKALELRAATSLARLWGERGRRGEAQDLLVPVYGWFTEGFDTADLKEAKALLEALV